MPTVHRRALGTLWLFAVLLAACTSVAQPVPAPAAAPAPSVTDKDVPALLVDLCGPDWQSANRAGELLAGFGEPAARTLVAKLSENNPYVCRAMMLRTLAAMPAVAAPILQDELRSSHLQPPFLGMYALALAQMGKQGLDAIAGAAQDPASGGSARSTAIGALPLLGAAGVDDLVAIAAASSADHLAILQGLIWLGEPALAAQKQVLANMTVHRQALFLETLPGSLYQQAAPLLVAVASDNAFTDTIRLTTVKMLNSAKTQPSGAIPTLLALAENSALTETLRSAAIDALGSYGAAAEHALPSLLRLLDAGPPQLQSHLLPAIGRIGAGDPAVAAALLERVGACCACAGESAVTAGVVAALGEVGLLAHPVQERVLAALAELSACPDAVIQPAALTALGRHGSPALPALQARLEAPLAPKSVQPLIDALAAVGTDAAPMLVAHLAAPDTSDAVRGIAVQAIGKIGAPALPSIVQAWRQGDEQAQGHLLEALYAVGPDAFAVLHSLRAQGGAVQPDMSRLQTIFATTTVTYPGLAVPSALPALIAAATPVTAALEQHKQAVRLIGWIGPPAAPAAPALAALLRYPDDQLQCQAAEAVRRIGSAAGAAAPALADALARRSATRCEFGDMPGSTSGPHARQMIAALAALGPAAAPAVDTLIAALADPELRRPAAEALGATGAAAHPALLRLLQSEQDSDVRRAAAYALRQSSTLAPGTALALGDLAQAAGATAYALRQPNTSLDPEAAALLTPVLQAAGEEEQVTAMLASALAVHGYAPPPALAAFGISAVDVRTCLSWPALAGSSLEALGYDPYLDACIFRGPPEAPDWAENVIGWLAEIFG